MNFAVCDKCGNDLGEDNSCSVCLLQLGVSNAGEQDLPEVPQPTLPSLDELNAQFPQLEITRLVGRGGMGAIYHARQKNLDRDVALKIIASDVARDAAFLERFEREAKTLARLSHPNIVTVFDYGQTSEGQAFLIMEFVDGINLREAIQSRSAGPEDALQIISTICEALKYAHGKGVVHRDIKPENILLGEDGTVKVADFGIAKIVDASVRTPTLTATRQVLGSVHYLAPEHLEAPAEVDHRVDLYALGVMLYELLTGQLPLGRYEPPSAVSPNTSNAALDQVVMKTLNRRPGQRFQDAAELSEALSSLSVEIPEAQVVSQPSIGTTASVPFSSEAMGGFAETVGVAFLEEGNLKLEHRTRDSIFGTLKSGTHLTELPLSSLARVEYVPGIFGAKIVLNADRISVFDSLPGSETGRVELKVKNRDAKLASHLVDQIQGTAQAIGAPVAVKASAVSADPAATAEENSKWNTYALLLGLCAILNFGLLAALLVLFNVEINGDELIPAIVSTSVLVAPIAAFQLLGSLLILVFRTRSMARAVAFASIVPITPAIFLSIPLGIWALLWLRKPENSKNAQALAAAQNSKGFGATTIAFIRESRWGKVVAAANVLAVLLVGGAFAAFQMGFYSSKMEYRIVANDVDQQQIALAVERRIGTFPRTNERLRKLEIWAFQYQHAEIMEQLKIVGKVSICWMLPEANNMPHAEKIDVADGLQVPTGYAKSEQLGQTVALAGPTVPIESSYFSQLTKSRSGASWGGITFNLTQRGKDAMSNQSPDQPQELIMGLVVDGTLIGVNDKKATSARQVTFSLSSDTELTPEAIAAAVRGPEIGSDLELLDQGNL